jgi:hypothetical protein
MRGYSRRRRRGYSTRFHELLRSSLEERGPLATASEDGRTSHHERDIRSADITFTCVDQVRVVEGAWSLRAESSMEERADVRRQGVDVEW